MSKNAKNHREPTHEEITIRARHIYEQEGRPEGRAMQHWLKAESQLKAEIKAQAASTQSKIGDGHAAPTQSNTGMRGPGWQTVSHQPATRN